MTSNELHAWRGDTHVAVFVDTGDGVSLHYDSDTASRLSLSFPTTGEFSNKAPARWLDGLLPERDRDREAFARKHDCSTEPFDLLQHVGADVGGAIYRLAAPGSGGYVCHSRVTRQSSRSRAQLTAGSPPLPRLFHPLTSSSRHWSTTRTFIASRLPPWNWPTVADYPQLAPG